MSLVAVLAATHSVLPLYRSSLFFFRRSSPNVATCSILTQIYKIQSEIWVGSSPKIWQPQNIKISARFCTTLRLDRECLWNTTRHRRSENDVANYRHSRTGKLNSVYFDPQKAQNRTGVLTYPTGSHQAGHCHASSFSWFVVYE